MGKKAQEKNLEAKQAKAAEAKKKRNTSRDRMERDQTRSRGRDRSRSRSRKREDDDEEEDEKADKEGGDDDEAAKEVELTEEENRSWFFRNETEDLPRKDLSSSFTRFAIPDDSEGFDEIRYAWQKRDGCVDYLTRWLAEKKLTQRVEELQPGSWFRSAVDEWQSLLNTWKRKHNCWKDSAYRDRGG